MPAKTSTRKAKAAPSNSSKTVRYTTVGQTSDGVAVLKPKAATSRLTALGTKVARLMAERRSMQTMTGAAKGSGGVNATAAVKRTGARKARQAAK